MRWITKFVLRRDTSAVRTRRACEGAMFAVLLAGAWFADVAAAATGRTVGMAGVTRDGEAAYVIPIRVTQGVAGLTPELAIAYGAPGARGTLGAGFSLTGLSAIGGQVRGSGVTILEAVRFVGS